jgi:predicted Zn-ribbon and HTH transcriptional regulator
MIEQFTRDDGAVVTVWSSTCKDCGFETGLARVTFPDGSGSLLSGAGCRSRRGVAEARRWASGVRR